MDANGNRTGNSQNEPYAPAIGDGNADYTYNTQKNRLLSTTVEGSFGYDDEGQLQTGYSTDYTFDYEHRLKTIGGTQFYYDGGGNRLKATRAGVITKYIYDAGGALLAEADANNNITRYYIYGNGLLAMVTPGDQTYCYHYNGVGSTIAMTNSSKAIVSKYSYDAFGNITNKLENTNLLNQPFTYVGQHGVMTEPNGFYYMKARYYDPTVGRFISEDPIGFDGGQVNLLAYVGNNPVNGIDPSGLMWKPNWRGVIKGAAEVIGGGALVFASVSADIASGGTATPLAISGVVTGTGYAVHGFVTAFTSLTGNDQAIPNPTPVPLAVLAVTGNQQYADVASTVSTLASGINAVTNINNLTNGETFSQISNLVSEGINLLTNNSGGCSSR
ncbi:MAG: hypothetical protein APR62_10650 [Smithella sp. SDB]|nr:MAG: hypothetical protein APR62_10650 [Smithella sp. SDB]